MYQHATTPSAWLPSGTNRQGERRGRLCKQHVVPALCRRLLLSFRPALTCWREPPSSIPLFYTKRMDGLTCRQNAWVGKWSWEGRGREETGPKQQGEQAGFLRALKSSFSPPRKFSLPESPHKIPALPPHSDESPGMNHERRRGFAGLLWR